MFFSTKKIDHNTCIVKDYNTDGKYVVTVDIKNIIKDVFKKRKVSMLSMPHLGRELNILDNLIDFSNSIGVENNKDTFNEIKTVIKDKYPELTLINKDVDHVKNINVDVAHLDYNGPLLEKRTHTVKELLKKDTLTFVTVNDHPRFKHLKVPIKKLAEIGNIIYYAKYKGINNCPMKTIGIVPKYF